MSKQVNYNENLCSGAAIRDDKGRRISKLFEASHPKMTVGYAKNLIMPDTPTEQEFNFRQSGGGVIEDGVAVIDKVKGNSVVWNQRVKNGNFADEYTGWDVYYGTLSVDNNILTYTVTAPTDGHSVSQNNFPDIVNHKYLFAAELNYSIKPTSTLAGFLGIGGYYGAGWNIQDIVPNSWFKVSGIATSTGDAATKDLRIYLRTTGMSAGDTVKVKNVVALDLTQMFGAGNEPATYEEFLSRKPKVADEYAYNEGTIVNNKVEKVVTTGRNLWDESKRVNGKYIDYLTGKEMSNAAYSHTGYVRVLPNTEYYFKQGATEPQYGAYYDADKNFILGLPNFKRVFTTPAQASYVRITLEAADSSDNICINISDPAINGQYFPYEKHELDLSWIKDIKDGEGMKLFEDGMKSAGTAFDEVGKNKAVKNIGSHTFDGTETITMEMSGLFNVSLSGIKRPATTNDVVGILMSGDFEVVRMQSEWGTLTKGISPNANITNAIFVCIKDETSVANVRSAILGKTILFELAEPIEVEYDEKNLTYPVVAGGTEEAIASEPSTAFRADIGYGIDAVKTILDLKARVEALEAK